MKAVSFLIVLALAQASLHFSENSQHEEIKELVTHSNQIYNQYHVAMPSFILVLQFASLAIIVQENGLFRILLDLPLPIMSF